MTVDDYGVIRSAHRDGMSVRAIARTLHHSRRKIRQVLAEPQPRPSTRVQEPAAPKLGPFKAVIDQILKDDEQAPPKQRHTAVPPKYSVRLILQALTPDFPYRR